MKLTEFCESVKTGLQTRFSDRIHKIEDKPTDGISYPSGDLFNHVNLLDF